MKETKQEKLVDRVLKRIAFVKYCLESGIEKDNDDMLWLFIFLALNVSVPRKSICDEHHAPFSFVADLYFERCNDAVVLGPRQGGKSFLLVGVLNILNMVFKPKIEIHVGGEEKSHAKEGYKYFKALLDAWWLREYLTRDPLKESTEFTNGSTIGLVTGSESGFNAIHGNILMCDEVDLIKSWEIIEQALSVPQEKNGYAAQLVFLSTRKKGSATMQKLVVEHKKRGFKLYHYCVWEVTGKCKLKMDCLKCGIYEKCEGRARNGSGHLKIEFVKKKAYGVDPQTWHSEWAAKTPVTTGMFYDFSRKHHVISVKDFCGKYGFVYEKDSQPADAIPVSWQKFAAIDWGYSAPLCMLAFAYDTENDIVYCYHEMYETKMTENDIKAAWHGGTRSESGRFVLQSKGFNWQAVPWWFIIADSAEPSKIASMNVYRKGKTAVIRTKKNEKSKEFSYSKVRKRLQLDETGHARLVFFDCCENAIREHESLSFPNNGSEFPNERTSSDHTTDVVRYGISRLFIKLRVAAAAKRIKEGFEILMG